MLLMKKPFILRHFSFYLELFYCQLIPYKYSTELNTTIIIFFLKCFGLQLVQLIKVYHTVENKI